MRRPVLAALLVLIASACAAGDADEGLRITELLRLRPGDAVADVGAGDGDWVHHLLEAVGPEGRVWATEVKTDLLDDLRERFASEGVRVVAGDQSSTGLPEACCDAILLRLVYHHFQEPAVMMADLGSALRPGGRLLLIETDTQENWAELEGVPERDGHGVAPDRLFAELREAGWTVISRHEPWDDDPERFAVVAAPQGSGE